MVFVYFIGHLQATAREYWLQEHGGGWLTHNFSRARRAALSRPAAIQPDGRYCRRNGHSACALLENRGLGLFYIIFYLPSRRRFFSGRNCDRSRPLSSSVLLFGAVRLPHRARGLRIHRAPAFSGVDFNLGLREQIGQLGFVAALSGFRSLVADVLFIQAHVAWERTEWGRVLLLFRQVTTLQPRASFSGTWRRGTWLGMPAPRR